MQTEAMQHAPMPDAPVWAILPVKDLAGAKTRLAPALGAGERRALFRAMIEDVMAALRAARRLDGVLVLTNDPEAAALAAAHGFRVEGEPANDGQTAAVTRAVRQLVAEGARTVMTLPGDVPLATGAEIDAALAAHGRAPAVTIVPAHDRRGSNAVICSPPDVIAFAFGNDSFEPHRAAARAAGARLAVLELPGIALDVDNPADLCALVARKPTAGTTRAHTYLEASGIAARLADHR